MPRRHEASPLVGEWANPDCAWLGTFGRAARTITQAGLREAMQNKESKNINATLDLPAHKVEGIAAQSEQLHRLTFAQLVAMVARIDRSRANAKDARAATDGQMNEALDQIDAQLCCMWAMAEAELERRVGGQKTL